jgi:hypothetical protein
MTPEAVEDPAGPGPVEPSGMSGSVPDAVREAARRAFDARRRDVHVADLVFDSLLDGDRRASADPSRRSLRFGATDAGAEVTIIEAGEALTIVVHALPPQECEIEVLFRDSDSRTITTSDAGQAEFTALPGLMSLVIRPTHSPPARPLQTAWVRV